MELIVRILIVVVAVAIVALVLRLVYWDAYQKGR